MATLIPSLDEAQKNFGQHAIDPSSNWVSLINNFEVLRPRYICIYHRMDVPHREFLDYPAYMSAFEMIVYHPCCGIVIVIDEAERVKQTSSLNSKFYKSFTNEIERICPNICIKKCTLVNPAGNEILESVDEMIKDMLKNNPLNHFIEKDLEVRSILETHLGISALPPEKLSEFGEFLETRFKRITKKTQIFSEINEKFKNRFEKDNDNSSDEPKPIRLYINGSAGSGKTLAALHLYNELSHIGMRPLLLCYNHLLGIWLNDRCKHTTDGYANTFLSFCLHRLNLIDLPYTVGDNANYFKILENLLDKLPDDGMPDDKYDVLIVDEGQDFKNEWMSVIERFLTNGYDMVWFEDDRQNIITPEKARVVLKDAICIKRINQNLRNPKSIIAYGNKLLENICSKICSIKGYENLQDLKEFKFLNMKGNPPRSHACNRDNLLEKVEQRAVELRQQGLEVIILSCRNTENLDSFTGKDEPSDFLKYEGNNPRKYIQEKLVNEKLCRDTGRSSGTKTPKIYEPEDGIDCDNILKFKGLERSSVILVDIEKPDAVSEDQWFQRMYCGLTRATYSLDIFYIDSDPFWESKAREIFKFRLAG